MAIYKNKHRFRFKGIHKLPRAEEILIRVTVSKYKYDGFDVIAEEAGQKQKWGGRQGGISTLVIHFLIFYSFHFVYIN